MKRTVFTVSKTFRCTTPLVDAINDLADRASRHPSELIRDAVTQYVRYYRDNLGELKAI